MRRSEKAKEAKDPGVQALARDRTCQTISEREGRGRKSTERHPSDQGMKQNCLAMCTRNRACNATTTTSALDK